MDRIIARIIMAVVTTVLVILSIIGIAAIIYLSNWLPVLDRITNTCKYYPNTFVDCKKEE